jgi:hypothetical protein
MDTLGVFLLILFGATMLVLVLLSGGEDTDGFPG